MSSEKQTSEEFLTTKAIKERGWSDGLIKRLLVEPDKTKVNFRHPSGPRIKLWSSERVFKAEKEEDFQKHLKRREGMSNRSKKLAADRKKALIEKAQNLEISVSVFDIEVLRNEAIEIAELRAAERGKYYDGRPNEETILRWTVNNIRHNYTHYDDFLRYVSDEPGADDARWIVQQRVFDAIKKAYPSLADECDRQIYIKEQHLNW